MRQLASGSRSPVYFEMAAGDPFRIAAINIMLFATLVFALVAVRRGAGGGCRKAYGVWVGASLLLPLSFPVTPQPLMSLPRFVAVLFPIFMWLAIVCDERRITDRVVAVSAIGLGLFTRPVRELALDLVTVVFLDALGTLVELKPPAPRLRTLLAEAGSRRRARSARRPRSRQRSPTTSSTTSRAPIEAALDDLRDRCAAVLREALALAGLDHAGARRAMLAALSFQPYPEVRGDACALCTSAGSPLIAVSNWDCSLCRWLEDAGSARPARRRGQLRRPRGSPSPTRRSSFALSATRAPSRSDVLHVGDSLDNDVAGARAAGIRPVLLCRDGESPAGVETIATLAELPSLL